MATMVLTVSELVRKQAMERFRLRADRVVAVPLAAPSRFRPTEAPPPQKPYFLFVGALEPRKNVPLLVEAWRQVRRNHDIDLVLVGRRREDFTALAEEPGLQLAGELPDSALSALYSGALAFVYPSAYEGFGLPILEAMQCGACVIASHAVAEAGGDAAVYSDSVEELVDAMNAAAADSAWVSEHRARSRARAALFSWDRTARETYEVYREARRRFER
jgi:glycosyltransferase involved in cell wall biosynthesis